MASIEYLPREPIPVGRNYREYMEGVWSQTDRSKVRRNYKAKLKERGLEFSGMNRVKRELLYDSVFPVLDAVESKAGGRPDDTRVLILRIVMAHLERDLGWSDV